MAYYLRTIFMSTGREVRQLPPDPNPNPNTNPNPNPNPDPNQVRQLPLILEFGAGSAELVPVVRRLGFGGAFLVYDLPPMLLLQVTP